jgi:hypothetical protein
MMRKSLVFTVSSRPEEPTLAQQALVVHHNTPVLPKPLLPLDMARAISLVESWLAKEDKERQVWHHLHHKQINKLHHTRCLSLDLAFKAHLALNHLLSRVVAMVKARLLMDTLLNLPHPPHLLVLAKALA